MLGKRIRSSEFVLAAVVGTAFPAAAAAGGADCGQTRSVYAVAVPDAFRSPGVHSFQWRDQFQDESGATIVDVGDNQIEIAAGAASYRGDVLRA